MPLIASPLLGYKRAVATAVKLSGMSVPLAWAGVLYARAFFGIGPLYHSLFSLYRVPFSEWADFVLDIESSAAAKKINLPHGQRLVTDKVAFYLRLQAANVPMIPVLGVVVRSTTGEGVPQGFNVLASAAAFARCAESFPDSVFLKTVDGSHGEGAFLAVRRNNEWSFAGHLGTAEDLFAYCVAHLGGRSGWLVQPQIRSCTALTALAPRALGTVRIVTVLKGENAHVLAALLKIPVGDSVVDNFSEGASGNIIAPIDPTTGRLGGGVMSRCLDWPEIVTVDRHPETGCVIAGFQMPFWDETVRLIQRAQLDLSEAPTLGWDVAVTDEGPVVVEANAGYSIQIHEVASQRGLRKDFSVVYDR